MTPDEFISHAVELRMRSMTAEVRHHLRKHLNALASVGATAPLVGIVGMYLGAIEAFRGCSGEKWQCLLGSLQALLRALPVAAMGFAVGLPSFWAYRYFSERAENFDVELLNAASEVLDWVGRQ